MKKEFQNKKLIVFDLDGTLTESKSVMDSGMAKLLAKLLEEKRVAVIGGGKFGQFKNQFTSRLECLPAGLKNLFLFPTNSTSFYRFERGRWKKIYEFRLKSSEVNKISKAFQETFKKFGYQHPERNYGPIIENRGTQITFSALGQEIVSRLGRRGLKLKEKWHRENNKLRLRMAAFLQKLLPEFEVRVGGLTSIDVTKKGIDKAYGVRQISKHLRIPIKDMLFVGDALFPGGNDYAARRTGVDCLEVSGPTETKKFINFLLAPRLLV